VAAARETFAHFFVSVHEHSVAYCRCREAVKLFRFLLSPYRLIGTCNSVQNLTAHGRTGYPVFIHPCDESRVHCLCTPMLNHIHCVCASLWWAAQTMFLHLCDESHRHYACASLWSVTLTLCCAFLWWVTLTLCCAFLWWVIQTLCCVFLWWVTLTLCCAFLWWAI
jgi:hypothetical protein